MCGHHKLACVIIGALAVAASARSARADSTTETLAAAMAANALHNYASGLKLLQPLAEVGTRVITVLALDPRNENARQ